jgi:hypothetical protein
MFSRLSFPALSFLGVAALGSQLPAQATATRRAATAAPAAESVDPAINARIRDEGLNRSKVLHTAIMLSDVSGPRLAGSPEYLRAAEWAIKELESYGTRAALEPWGVHHSRGWQVEEQSVEMIAPYYARLIAYPKAWSPSTSGTITGTPQIVSIRADSDLVKYKGKIRGSIVMNGVPRADTTSRFVPPAHRLTDAELDSLAKLTNPGDPKTYWDDAGGYAERVVRGLKRAIEIAKEGVAVMLEPSRNLDAVGVSAYQAYDNDVSSAVPAFVVARGDYQRVLNLLDARIPVELKVTLRTRYLTGDSVGYNVIAEIPGTDPKLASEVVMLGGHFDGWPSGTAATDNAAGCAVAMEVMRILKATGARPRRTIRLALWDGEEHEDYFGSLGYVRKHFGDPETMKLKPEQSKISAYFNFDNGTGRVRGIYMQGNEALRPIFSSFLAPFADLGANHLTIINQGSTDLMPFTSVGIPAFNFIQDPIDYESRTHHTNFDVAGNLLEGDLKQAAVITASVVLHTANRDERLPRLPLPAPHASK